METQYCNSSDIRPEAKVGSVNASNNCSADLIEDFNDVPSNQGDFDQSTIDPSAHPSKKIRSKVWDHLIKIRAENLKDQKTQCKYYNAILGADPAKGNWHGKDRERIPDIDITLNGGDKWMFAGQKVCV
ncbi:Glyoxalase 2-5 [Ancistrocladus abbreviatus]